MINLKSAILTKQFFCSGCKKSIKAKKYYFMKVEFAPVFIDVEVQFPERVKKYYICSNCASSESEAYDIIYPFIEGRRLRFL